jgi:hypothetical protein
MPVTRTSIRFCHLDSCVSDVSFRVTILEPTTMRTMTAQVNTIVAFRIMGPHRRIIRVSGLIRIGQTSLRNLHVTTITSRSYLTRQAIIWPVRPPAPHEYDPDHEKTYETGNKPLPATAHHEIEAQKHRCQPSKKA